MSRFAKISGALLTVALTACSSTSTSDTAVTKPTAADRTATTAATTTTVGPKLAPVGTIGTYGVGSREKTYVDESRPTASNGSYKGAATRTLHTYTWYPSSDAKPGKDVADGGAPDTKSGAFP